MERKSSKSTLSLREVLYFQHVPCTENKIILALQSSFSFMRAHPAILVPFFLSTIPIHTQNLFLIKFLVFFSHHFLVANNFTCFFKKEIKKIKCIIKRNIFRKRNHFIRYQIIVGKCDKCNVFLEFAIAEKNN